MVVIAWVTEGGGGASCLWNDCAKVDVVGAFEAFNNLILEMKKHERKRNIHNKKKVSVVRSHSTALFFLLVYYKQQGVR